MGVEFHEREVTSVSLDDAIIRARSHDWVVPVPMPVTLTLGTDDAGNVVVANVWPKGLPAVDKLGSITCERCGATDFDKACDGQAF